MANVEEIIRHSLERFISIKDENQNEQGEKLIFPRTRTGKEEKRLSEQEIKLLFIDELIKCDNEYYYAVEAPTILPYRFSTQEMHEIVPRIAFNGTSARTDICLYIYENGYKRKHLIEFKAKLSTPFSMQKDFLKLKYEGPEKNSEATLDNYFVHVLDRYDAATIKSLQERYEKSFSLKDSNGKQTENRITVFLCMREIPEKYIGCNNIIRFCENNYQEELNHFLSGK